MKKIFLLLLLALLSISLSASCTSMEEKREAHMEKARQAEQSGDCVTAVAEAENALRLDSALVEGYLLQGRCEMRAKNWQGASDKFSRALTLQPDRVEVLLNLARISLFVDDIAKAGEYVDKAAVLAPEAPGLTAMRAAVFMKQKEFEKAKPLLESALQSAPPDEELVVGLASAFINTGESPKAKNLLRDNLKKFPDSSAILSQLLTIALADQDFSIAQEYLQQIMTQHPEEENFVLQASDIYLLADQEEDSVAVLEKHLQQYPRAANVRVRLADAWIKKGQIDKALELLGQAPEATPVLDLARASALTQAARADEAIVLLRGIVDGNKPGEAVSQARIGLAEIYAQKGMPKEALSELDTLIEQTPGNMRARFLRGGIYFGQQRYGEAVADLEEIVKKTPDDLDAVLGLADAHNAAGNTEIAELLITDVIKRAPKYERGYLTLANFYLARQKSEAALVILGIGKKELPNSAEITFGEADILASLQRFAEAQNVLEETAKSQNKEVRETALFRLASVYRTAGEQSKAVDTYDRILDANPESSLAANERIRAQIAQGKPREALAFAEKRQKQRPEDPEAAYMAAEAAMGNQNLAKEEKALLRALELAPAWELPLRSLVQLYASTQRLEDAIDFCRKLAANLPEKSSFGPMFFLGILQELKGEFKAAEAMYREVLARWPSALLAANNMAYLITRHEPTPERLAEAEAFARTAVAAGEPSIFDTLGWILYLRGNNAEAEKNLRKAQDAESKNSTFNYHLATVLAAQGNKDKIQEARLLLEAITGPSSDFPELEQAKKLLESLVGN